MDWFSASNQKATEQNFASIIANNSLSVSNIEQPSSALNSTLHVCFIQRDLQRSAWSRMAAGLPHRSNLR